MTANVASTLRRDDCQSKQHGCVPLIPSGSTLSETCPDHTPSTSLGNAGYGILTLTVTYTYHNGCPDDRQQL